MFRQLMSKVLIPSLEQDLSRAIQTELSTAHRMTDVLFVPHVKSTTEVMNGTISRRLVNATETFTTKKTQKQINKLNSEHQKTMDFLVVPNLEQDLSHAIQTELSTAHRMTDELFVPHVTSTITKVNRRAINSTTNFTTTKQTPNEINEKLNDAEFQKMTFPVPKKSLYME